MATAARLALAARRNEVARFTIAVTGIDLTGVAMAMQVRLLPDTPGSPLISLATVTSATDEGLHLDSVTTTNGVTTSIIKGRINAATMTDADKVPYSGEVGDNSVLAYAMQWTLGGDAQTRLYGDFIVLASAFGSDAAPASRPVGYGGSQCGSAGGTGSLTFGDQVVQVSVDGIDQLATLVGQTQVAHDQTLGALQAIYGILIGFPIAGDPNKITVGGSDPVDQQTFSFLVTAANTGPVLLTRGSITRHVVVPGTNADLGAGALPLGDVATVQWSYPGQAYVLKGVVAFNPSSGDVGSDPTFLDAQADANGARKALEGIFGFKIARPYSDNPNGITVDGAATPADNSTFDVLIAATNTGNTTMFYGGLDHAITANAGTGAPLAGGELVSGKVVTFKLSVAGSVFILVGSRDLDLGESDTVTAPAMPIGSQDVDLSVNPWGTIPTSGGAVTAIPKKVLVIGSSNAATGYVADGSLPSQLIPASLNAAHPGEGILFTGETQAVQGAPWAASGGQLAASAAFVAGTVKWVFPFYWMNDARTIFYHDYGGVNSVVLAISGTIDNIRSKGAEPVMVTGFHPDPRADPSTSAQALDPFYFTANPSRGSSYSPIKSAPVDPVADMVPAATVADFMIARDWSGSGVIRTGFKRVWHINHIIRIIAAQKGCMLLDLERSTYRFCLETVGDLSADLNTFYNAPAANNPLHSLAAMYQQGIKPVIDQWARAMVEGRDDIRVFTGFSA